MKKALIITGAIILLLIVAMIATPILFKDDIKKAIDAELAKSVNADIYFEPENFSLTFFKNFPNITASLKEFGVINREPFAGEILFAVRELDVEVNLKSVLFEDQLRIKGITLDKPEINILVMEDGTPNYDIAIADTTTVEVDTASAEEEMQFGIDHWEVIDGHIVYNDASIPYRMELTGVNHTGRGDFTLSVFDMDISVAIDSVDVEYDGVNYMKDKSVSTEMVMTMDLDQYKFTFKDNISKVNDFGLTFEGWFSMPEEGYEMDINYGAENNTFKSLLSLVPGMYGEGFEDLESEGTLSFSGHVRGVYSEEQMPAFGLNLEVEDGYFKYPDLPESVNDVNISVRINNEDGVIDNTMVNISRFAFNMGGNPVDGSLAIDNLVNYPIKANMNAKVDLASLNKIYPIEGTDLRGIYSLSANAEGIYDSVKKIVPAINVDMSLTDGFIKSSEMPVPLEKFNFKTSIVNNSGKMDQTVIDVESFSFVLENEEIRGNFHIEDLTNYTWNGSLSGAIDLERIMKIFPQDGMELQGKISASLTTAGNYEALEAERYDQLPTSGSINVKDLKYVDKELLPYGLTISRATASFSPQKASIDEYKGTIGRSDLDVKGSVSNYIGYLFMEGQTLMGSMSLKSNLLDLNEPMSAYTSGDEEETTSEEDAPLEVIPIPDNIDFTFQSGIGKILYDNMELSDVTGKIIVRDGKINLEGLNFNMLGGQFNLAGTYSTQDPEKPFFDFKMDIDDVSIKESFSTFSTVQKFAPIAEKVAGNLSTEFDVSGNLGTDMMPLYSTLNGGGVLEIIQATLQNSKLLGGVTSLTGLENTNSASLKDVLMSVSIKDGKLSARPFNINLGEHQATVSGDMGIDGSLDYKINMEVPAGQLGSQFNSLVSSLSGEQRNSEKVNITIELGGTYDNPRPQLETAELKDQVKSTVKKKAEEEIKEEANKLINNLVTSKSDTTDSTSKTDLASKVVEKDSVKEEVEETVKEVKEEAKEKLKDLFKRK